MNLKLEGNGTALYTDSLGDKDTRSMRIEKKKNPHQRNGEQLFISVEDYTKDKGTFTVGGFVLPCGLANMPLSKKNYHVKQAVDELMRICPDLKTYEGIRDIFEAWIHEAVDREGSLDVVVEAEYEKEELPEYSEEERQQATELLNDKLLLHKAKKLLDKQVVGEDKTKLLIYLLCCGRKSKKPPLSVLLTGHSAAGKSYVISAVLRMLPEQNLMNLHRMSETALDYADGVDFDEKILFITEASGFLVAAEKVKATTDGSKPGAAYVSEKDEATGRFTANLRGMKGIPLYLSTSAKILKDVEQTNRFLVASVDMSKEQTKKILKRGVELAAAPWEEIQDDELRMWQCAFSMLERYDVEIPYATVLEDYFPDDQVRSRRDQPKLFSLIAASAVLHQYQREKFEVNGKTYIIADLQDLWNAHIIASSALMLSAESLQGGAYDFFCHMLDALPAMKDLNDAKRKGDIIKAVQEKGMRISKTTAYEYLDLLEDQGLLIRDIEARKLYFSDGKVTEKSDKDLAGKIRDMKIDMLKPNLPIFRNSGGCKGGDIPPLKVEVVNPIAGDTKTLWVGGIPPSTLSGKPEKGVNEDE